MLGRSIRALFFGVASRDPSREEQRRSSHKPAAEDEQPGFPEGFARSTQMQDEAAARARAEMLAQEAEAAAERALQAARFHQAQARRAVGEPRRGELEKALISQRKALQSAHEWRRRAAEQRAAEPPREKLAAEIATADEVQVSASAGVLQNASQQQACEQQAVSSEMDMRPQRFPQRRDIRAITPRAHERGAGADFEVAPSGRGGRSVAMPGNVAETAHYGPLIPAWLGGGASSQHPIERRRELHIVHPANVPSETGLSRISGLQEQGC